MQPSMGTLNSPSSRVGKNSTPSRRRILRCINFGIGNSSPNLFLNMMKFYVVHVKFEAQWILNERAFYCFNYFVYLKVNLDLEITNQLGESSLNFIFAAVNLDPVCYRKKGELMVDLGLTILLKGEQRWRLEVDWVGSRCPFTCALMQYCCGSYKLGVAVR